MLISRRSATAAATVACLCGCVKWVAEPVPQPPAPAHFIRGAARVRTLDGRTVELTNVVIATDSLIGLTNDLARLRVALPLNRVAAVSVRQRDPAMTAVLIVAIAAVVILTGLSSL